MLKVHCAVYTVSDTLVLCVVNRRRNFGLIRYGSTRQSCFRRSTRLFSFNISTGTVAMPSERHISALRDMMKKPQTALIVHEICHTPERSGNTFTDSVFSKTSASIMIISQAAWTV